VQDTVGGYYDVAKVLHGSLLLVLEKAAASAMIFPRLGYKCRRVVLFSTTCPSRRIDGVSGRWKESMDIALRKISGLSGRRRNSPILENAATARSYAIITTTTTTLGATTPHHQQSLRCHADTSRPRKIQLMFAYTHYDVQFYLQYHLNRFNKSLRKRDVDDKKHNQADKADKNALDEGIYTCALDWQAIQTMARLEYASIDIDENGSNEQDQTDLSLEYYKVSTSGGSSCCWGRQRSQSCCACPVCTKIPTTITPRA
jgi:hypothetical protein